MGQQNRDTPITRAGGREYKDFFILYSRYVSLGRQEGFAGLVEEKGVLFLPLGFVPGEAVILRRLEDGFLQRVDATPGARAKIRLPAEPVEADALPDEVREPLAEWQTLIQGLGQELSPWSLGLASRLLQGEMPTIHLTVGFIRFQAPGAEGRRGQEVPFGISLTPDWGGVKVERVYNPGGLANVPSEGDLIPLEEIQRGGQNPLAKVLRTWAKMEGQARRTSRPNDR